MNTMNTTVSIKEELAALIGIDWASQQHALCLYDCATAQREASTLAHTRGNCALGARARAAFCGEEDCPVSGANARSTHERALGVSLLCPLPSQSGNGRALPASLQNQPGQGRSQGRRGLPRVALASPGETYSLASS